MFSVMIINSLSSLGQGIFNGIRNGLWHIYPLFMTKVNNFIGEILK